MRFTLHRDGTISVHSFAGRTKKNATFICDSEIAEAGTRKKALERHSNVIVGSNTRAGTQFSGPIPYVRDEVNDPP